MIVSAAPARFAIWMDGHVHVDKLGHKYRYHSRSDAHSIELCKLILADLLVSSSVLQLQADRGVVAYGINASYISPSGKAKNLDLAIGTASQGAFEMIGGFRIRRSERIDVLRIACEAKSTMTEHGKSQPRMYDELSSSHEIVHQADREAIAAGIAVINIADRFASPLRQKANGTIHYTQHKQPHATKRMVEHLGRLPLRNGIQEPGFDAFATIVISCDNTGGAELWTAPPAPQPASHDHYATFVERIVTRYEATFSTF
jgi:hypothetical protein